MRNWWGARARYIHFFRRPSYSYSCSYVLYSYSLNWSYLANPTQLNSPFGLYLSSAKIALSQLPPISRETDKERRKYGRIGTHKGKRIHGKEDNNFRKWNIENQRKLYQENETYWGRKNYGKRETHLPLYGLLPLHLPHCLLSSLELHYLFYIYYLFYIFYHSTVSYHPTNFLIIPLTLSSIKISLITHLSYIYYSSISSFPTNLLFLPLYCFLPIHYLLPVLLSFLLLSLLYFYSQITLLFLITLPSLFSPYNSNVSYHLSIT